MTAAGSPKIPRAAIIGLGGFGEAHLNALSALEQEGLCRVVGGCDPQIDALKARWSGPFDHLHLFKTAEELFHWGEIDYVVIASPPHLHQEQTVQALDRGLFVYLEKPPMPTFWQMEEVLRHSGADRIAVGFQQIEAEPIRVLKARLNAGELGELSEVSASGLWPRATTYYQRASWAGRMQAAGRPVFDGPMTNALAHIVHNVFFLAGKGESAFAVPRRVSGFFAHARPIESYDFAWIKGVTEDGVLFNLVAGHCSEKSIGWTVSVRTDQGLFSIGENDVPTAVELLGASHRTALAACQGTGRVTTSLADCLGYSMATTAGLISSAGIHAIPSDEIKILGEGDDTVYHVERIYQMIRHGQKDDVFSADGIPWLKCGSELDSRSALATPSPLFG